MLGLQVMAEGVKPIFSWTFSNAMAVMPTKALYSVVRLR